MNSSLTLKQRGRGAIGPSGIYMPISQEQNVGLTSNQKLVHFNLEGTRAYFGKGPPKSASQGPFGGP